jgi:hypothetical protein
MHPPACLNRGEAGAMHRPIHDQLNQSHDEHWMTSYDAGDKENVVAKCQVACAQFRINICAINVKMDSLNPQDANSPLGGSTDVRFQKINHWKKDFVLWAVWQ